MNTRKIKKAIDEVLLDAGFNPEVNRTTNPKHNSDRLEVGAYILARLYKEAKHVPTGLTPLPLSLTQVKRRKDKEGFIKVVMVLSIEELGVGVDCLNDACSSAILGDDSGLEDISYRPVGIEDDNVLVEVTGNVDNWLERQENDDGDGRPA